MPRPFYPPWFDHPSSSLYSEERKRNKLWSFSLCIFLYSPAFRSHSLCTYFYSDTCKALCHCVTSKSQTKNKNPSLDPKLSQLNPLHILIAYSFRMYFSTILSSTSVFPNLSLPFSFCRILTMVCWYWTNCTFGRVLFVFKD
jgi:hypothetical protein